MIDNHHALHRLAKSSFTQCRSKDVEIDYEHEENKAEEDQVMTQLLAHILIHEACNDHDCKSHKYRHEEV